MRVGSLLLACIFSLSTLASYAQVSLPYGDGAGKVGFINGNNFPGIEEPVPLGPKSFRLADDHVWVVDSTGGKLLKLNKEKGLVGEFSLLASPPLPLLDDLATNSPNLEVMIEDFAPVYDSEGRLSSFWFVDLMNNRLMNYALDGKKLGEIKHEKFVQPFRVEVGRNGHVFVADKGAQSIFVFDAEQKLVAEPNWEWSGFAVGAEDKLYRLFYESENNRTYLVLQNLQNTIEKEIELDLPEHMNPELWWVDEAKEEVILTFTPATGFNGKFVVARVGFDGKIKASGDLMPPLVMNRFIDHQGFDEVWLGAADYNTAPEGKFSVVPTSLP
jgi:hypothetical protein